MRDPPRSRRLRAALPDADPAWTPPGAGHPPIATDPRIVTELIERSEASIAAAKRDIQTMSGLAMLDFILADIQELKRIQSDPRSLQVIMAAIEAAWWLNDHLQTWLGEKNAADTLTQSVPNNVTSEMGLALLDVADAIRPHPDVVAFLQHVEDERFSRRAATSSRADEKRATPSRPGSTNTACAASARSTSRGRDGANVRPCSCH